MDLGAVVLRSEALRFGASLAMTKVRPKAGAASVVFPKPGFWGPFFLLLVVFSFSIPLKISMFSAEIAPWGGLSTSFTMNFSYKSGYTVLSTQRNGDLGVGPAA